MRRSEGEDRLSDQRAESLAVQPIAEPAAALPPAAKKGPDWWAEVKGIFWLVLAVLAFHSFIAKPFYIPSESMMPTLITGDRLVVTKFPYGWSYVSVTTPSIPGRLGEVLGKLTGQEHFGVPDIPFIKGRLFGRTPARGDIVIVKPVDQDSDYIKRVIGLPGDRLEVRHGVVILNGVPVKREWESPALVPIDANLPCDSGEPAIRRVSGADGKAYCAMPRVRETLPGGVSFDTIDLVDDSPVDNYPATTIPEDHVFLMGDNRDQSADSRVPSAGKGLGGPVPIENIGGRAEFITFSLDGTSSLWNPLSWFTAMRGGRAGSSLHPDKAP
jgi:signal peptidase I